MFVVIQIPFCPIFSTLFHEAEKSFRSYFDTLVQRYILRNEPVEACEIPPRNEENRGLTETH